MARSRRCLRRPLGTGCRESSPAGAAGQYREPARCRWGPRDARRERGRQPGVPAAHGVRAGAGAQRCSQAFRQLQTALSPAVYLVTK